MRSLSRLVVAACWLCLPASAFCAGPAVVELSCGKTTYQGARIAHDSSKCWLVAQDGRLAEIDLSSVTAFRTVSPQFKGFSTLEVRSRLETEFRGKFEVMTEGRYVVCAAHGSAGKYAETFDNLYRTFRQYFSVRGFSISEPQFPMIAIVFPTRAEFAEYAKKDGVAAPPGMMGYYHQLSNRVALFDPVGGDLAAKSVFNVRGILETSTPSAWEDLIAGRFVQGSSVKVHAKIEAGLEDTIIHEGTHQVAFNTGLHARIGQNPKWVVEGLATVFESAGVRNPAAMASPKTRLNRERFIWFGEYAKKRREPKSLGKFLGSDASFQASMLDAYSESWALSFYLFETRPSQYARYLKGIAQRDLLKAYPAEERVADFKKAFGSDLALLEADFVRFIQGLN